MDWDKMTPTQVLAKDFDSCGTPLKEANLIGWDLGTGDKTIETVIKDGKIVCYEETEPLPKWPVELKAPETTRIYNNKMPTHDPYSNPNALIYYECGCGAILDPLTKSFASLNNHASNMGWKIRFGETGYTPYCVKCGEGVE